MLTVLGILPAGMSGTLGERSAVWTGKEPVPIRGFDHEGKETRERGTGQTGLGRGTATGDGEAGSARIWRGETAEAGGGEVGGGRIPCPTSFRSWSAVIHVVLALWGCGNGRVEDVVGALAVLDGGGVCV